MVSASLGRVGKYTDTIHVHNQEKMYTICYQVELCTRCLPDGGVCLYRASAGEYSLEATSFNSQQLAERERRRVIGEVAIMDMSNEDLFSTLPRGRRAASEDPDVKSSDFATQVPYHS